MAKITIVYIKILIAIVKPAAIKNAHVNNFLKIALNNVNAIENYVVVLFVL
jgi:hypothetical protein